MKKLSIEAVLFDAGGTLIVREPPDEVVLKERWMSIGLQIDLNSARQAVKRADFWSGEQIQRELNGSRRLSDEEFDWSVEQAALLAVFPNAKLSDISFWLDMLRALPKTRQTWQRFPMAEQTLGQLQSMGLRLACVSNFYKTLPGLLGQLGLARYFDSIVCSSFVGVEKPDPGILLIACRQLKIDPGDAAYVGNHPFDVVCANKAGMTSIWIRFPGDTLPLSTNCHADFEIAHLADIMLLLSPELVPYHSWST
jgi:putative hydrolase of the HAD superfamily